MTTTLALALAIHQRFFFSSLASEAVHHQLHPLERENWQNLRWLAMDIVPVNSFSFAADMSDGTTRLFHSLSLPLRSVAARFVQNFRLPGTTFKTLTLASKYVKTCSSTSPSRREFRNATRKLCFELRIYALFLSESSDTSESRMACFCCGVLERHKRLNCRPPSSQNCKQPRGLQDRSPSPSRNHNLNLWDRIPPSLKFKNSDDHKPGTNKPFSRTRATNPLLQSGSNLPGSRHHYCTTLPIPRELISRRRLEPHKRT